MADKLLNKVQKLKERKELLSHVVNELEYTRYATEDKFEDEEDLVGRRNAVDFLTRICVDELSEIEEKFSKIREIIRNIEVEKKKDEENSIIMEMIQEGLRKFEFEMKLSCDLSDIEYSIKNVTSHCWEDSLYNILWDECHSRGLDRDYYLGKLEEGVRDYIEKHLSEITNKLHTTDDMFDFFILIKVWAEVKITQDMVDTYNSILPDLYLETLLEEYEE